ncbi:MAG: hypothetical protein IJX86_08525 [Lachnospiraceae bacterium]|nr:hypothetical protein [Lachnospiraceae bacterium]
MLEKVELNYKNGKIAQEIIALQNDDGTWGNEFHSLSIPNNKKPLTTEQALRRLKLLGFTINDAPIKKAVDCMVACLNGERKIDNYREKTRDWDLFTKLMLSTWVRIFEPDNRIALECAEYWVNVIEEEFANGKYESDTGEVDFVTFYEMNLLQGLLSKETESRMLDYVINHKRGIYYIYGKRISELPKEFQSIETSRYLDAIDILSGYKLAKEKLAFVTEWLKQNQDENGQWDLGPKAKDNLYFPLSDSWRNAEYRKADCTDKINSIIRKLT